MLNIDWPLRWLRIVLAYVFAFVRIGVEQYLHGVCNLTSIWVYFFEIYNALIYIYIDKICSAQIADPKQKQNKNNRQS